MRKETLSKILDEMVPKALYEIEKSGREAAEKKYTSLTKIVCNIAITDLSGRQGSLFLKLLNEKTIDKD